MPAFLAAIAFAALTLSCNEPQERATASESQTSEAATDGGRDSTEFAKLHEQWIRAFQQHDPKLIEPLLADDFIAYGPEPATKQQMMEAAKDTSGQLESVSHNEMRVRVLGSARDVALVTGSVTAKARQKGQMATMTNRYTEVWEKPGGRWQCVGGQYFDFPAKS